jgi:hypothetical protein
VAAADKRYRWTRHDISFRVHGGFGDGITDFSGTFTATRITGTVGGSDLGSFAVNRQLDCFVGILRQCFDLVITLPCNKERHERSIGKRGMTFVPPVVSVTGEKLCEA